MLTYAVGISINKPKLSIRGSITHATVFCVKEFNLARRISKKAASQPVQKLGHKNSSCDIGKVASPSIQ